MPDVLSYGYNDRNEVTSAASNNNAAYNYAYNYDPIGNRNTANLAGTSFQYTANALNQYTAVNTDAPTYDFDGNMLTNGAWTYTWNGENRMIAAVNGNTRLEFTYDYMGRRVEKKVYDGETLSKHTKFVYNGFKLVEELDALNNNATFRKYTWQPRRMGLDVPLSVYDATLDATYFYATDANKNVSELTDGTGAVVAHYEYSPFGTQATVTGAYAATNPFRFSSEYYDAETGLVYYNYRYYNPGLGRWTSRDPIEEEGGENLYGMAGNDVVDCWDNYGNDYAEAGSLAISALIVSQADSPLPGPADIVAVAMLTVATAMVVDQIMSDAIAHFSRGPTRCPGERGQQRKDEKNKHPGKDNQTGKDKPMPPKDKPPLPEPDRVPSPKQKRAERRNR